MKSDATSTVTVAPVQPVQSAQQFQNPEKTSSVPAELREQIQAAYDRLIAAEGFTPRRGQKLMIGRISRQLQAALAEGSSEAHIDPFILVEAGTGVGKTVGYLLPGLVFARHYQKQLVISTATANLQDQLLNKDLPMVTANLDDRFNIALGKGRGRYLCDANIDLLMTDSGAGMDAYFDQGMAGLTAEAQALYDQLRTARQQQAWDGDRDHWPEAIEDSLWKPVTSTRRACSGPRCEFFDQCAFYRARQDLDDADCVVVNHDLLLADLALGGGVILPAPENAIYVFDEAHHLAERARQHLSCRLAPLQLANLLDELENSLSRFSRWPDLSAKLRDACLKAGQLKFQLDEPLSTLIRLCQDSRPAGDSGLSRSRQGSNVTTTLRFEAGLLPQELAETCAEMRLPLTQLLVIVEGLAEELQEAVDEQLIPSNEVAGLINLISDWCARLEGACSLVGDWSDDSRNQHASARWINYYAGGAFELHSSPLEVGETLADQLWQRASAAVFTSATLGVAGQFDATRQAMGLAGDTLALGIESPFDYPRIGKLCICRDAPDPRDSQAYDDYLAKFLNQKVQPEDATLVLFNSVAQLERTFESLSGKLQTMALVQGRMGRSEIVRRHCERVDEGQGSLILGLRSMAEGVDLPGSYCTHLVITRIPFSVPDDPVEATLAELLEQQGKNPFREISLPGAAIRLVQAVGRLIRSETDHGTVSVVDPRLANRGYSAYLRSALPPLALEYFQMQS